MIAYYQGEIMNCEIRNTIMYLCIIRIVQNGVRDM